MKLALGLPARNYWLAAIGVPVKPPGTLLKNDYPSILNNLNETLR
jgi:hypothetical protein